MAIEFLENTDPVTANSLVIPVANLSGFNALADFQNANANVNLARFFVGFMEKSYNVMSPSNFLKLGIGLAKTITALTPASAVNFNINYGATMQFYIEADTAPRPLPLPTIGTNLGLGDFSLVSLFAGIAKVAAGAAVAADSIAIPVSDLEPYGSPAYASINLANGQDNRDVWMALIRYLFDSLVVRATNTVSAVTAKSINAPTIPTLPAIYTDAANPTTGIDSTLLYGQATVEQRTVSATVEMALDGSTLAVNINHV